jgi:CheY-like chemotaxis protein
MSAPASMTGDADAGQSLSIVVADDNVDAAQTLAMLLEMLGHRVRTALDGLEAVRLAQEQAPDLAILDIGMPRLNGYEAAERITGIAPDAVLFAVSGYADAASVQRGKQAGFDHHFAKPLDMQSFVAALKKVADRSSS